MSFYRFGEVFGVWCFFVDGLKEALTAARSYFLGCSYRIVLRVTLGAFQSY